MIQHVWEAVQDARMLGDVIIATDAAEIVDCVQGFGGKAVLTPSHFTSGTDRVAFLAASRNFPIVVNIQGDEPLIKSEMIDALVEELEAVPGTELATLAVKKVPGDELQDPNVVKVVLARDGRALYFSRQPLAIDPAGSFYKHIGIYAYRREALLQFCDLPPSELETAERLEQLRALENGMRVQVVMTQQDTIAVDTPLDIAKVERFLLGAVTPDAYNRSKGRHEN